MECSENVQLSLAAPGQRHSARCLRPVVLGRRPQQVALGLQQEDSARVRRRVVSGQNQRQEASVQPQEVRLAQRSLRVVDLAVDSARVRRRVVSGQNQPQEALVQPQEVHLAQ